MQIEDDVKYFATPNEYDWDGQILQIHHAADGAGTYA